jgi:hypothetical protein
MAGLVPADELNPVRFLRTGEGTAAHVRASEAGDDAVAKLTATIPALGKFAG